MKNDRSFLKCEICGNIMGIIEDAGVLPVCCGQEMTLLKPNTADAAAEKHVPVVKQEGGVITVDVGSVAHPMTPDHYISWIAVAQEGHTQRVSLSPDCQPTATFFAYKGPATVYAYCNLHGLWSAEL